MVIREQVVRACHWFQVFIVALVAVVATCESARATDIHIKIDGTNQKAQVGVLLKQIVQIPKEFESETAAIFEETAGFDDGEVPNFSVGQLASPSLGASLPLDREGMITRELIIPFVVLESDHTKVMKAKVGNIDALEKRIPNFQSKDKATQLKEREKFLNGASWHDTPGKQIELRFYDVPALRYMYEPVDNSSKERRAETFKVYHHVFDPEGDRLLTKGPGGLFPHHRGLFYGFNKISYGDRQADVWHCNHGESQQHVKVHAQDSGPLLGRHRLAIDWHGRDGKVFAKEEREVSALVIADLCGITGDKEVTGTMIDFVSKLTSTVGPLKLDGDPQHAGFQFRASQEVPDKTKDQTYYLRPDRKGAPGKFRNWPQDKGHENLPWNALSFVIEDQRYTVVYLDHPKNPKPARYSERDYGRFGSYFVAELDEGKPLTVQYRVWVQRGEMTVEECEALSEAFVEPVKATVEVR